MVDSDGGLYDATSVWEDDWAAVGLNKLEGPDCQGILKLSESALSFPWKLDGASGCVESEMLCESWRSGFGGSPLTESRLRGGFLGCASCCCLLAAMGKDNPRNLPRLATPTPQVKVVLYPAQSFPPDRQGVQYGLFLSHLIFWLEQVKQSLAAPVAGARLRFLRSGEGVAAVATVGSWLSGTDIATQSDGENF